MKLIVTVKAGDATKDIVLPVGLGTQSFKWLADAAAFRFVHDGTREWPLSSSLLPKDVYSDDCPFYHPEDTVSDHIVDGQKLTVELYTELPLDEFGIPALSRWSFIAFRHGESHEELRRQYIEEKKFEVENFRKERERKAKLRQLEIDRPKIAKMQQVLSDQLIDASVIEKTVNEEWALIKESGVLDNLVPDKEQQEEIRFFLVKNFLEINDIFKFYSAVNSGTNHTLEFIELEKILTDTSVLGEEHSSAILRIFVDCHISSTRKKGGKTVKPSIHSEIQRHEFFLALIKIAIFKFITLPKKEIARLHRQGQHVSNSKRDVPNAPKALKLVYDNHLAPVIAKMPAGSKMRDAIASKDVLILLYDNLEALKTCFDKFSGSESDLISLSEFSLFADRAGFIGGDPQMSLQTSSSCRNGRATERKSPIMGDKPSGGVTQRDIRQICSASQNDRNDVSQYETMTFSEFLEAIARLGVIKFAPDSDEQEDQLSCYECIKRAVDKVISATT